jgi:hypothetical protein
MSTLETYAKAVIKNAEEAEQDYETIMETHLAKKVAMELISAYSSAETFEGSGIDAAIEAYYSELLRNAEVIDRRGMSVDEKITINSNILVDMLRDALENALTVLRPDLWDDEEKPDPKPEYPVHPDFSRPKPGPRRA